MIHIHQIRPKTVVVDSNNNEFAVVVGVEQPNSIKLAKDASGRHHYVPLNWVKQIDERVHLDRPFEQAMREWRSVSTQN